MIVVANDPETRAIAAEALRREAGVKLSPDFQAIIWANKDTHMLEWVVGYDSFLGKTCQMHMVNFFTRRAPREMLRVSFDYPFNQLNLMAVLGVVNSTNEKAMRFDLHLGFKEEARLVGMHDDGGDIVLLRMNREDCRWIKERKHEELLVA